MTSAYAQDPYYAQSNDPRDLYREHFNISQERQQHRLGSDLMGGSWSQPIWAGWHPIIGAGRQDVFQRFAQDGDSGFFHGMHGCGRPLGMNPFPPNAFEAGENTTPSFEAQHISTIEPVYVQPSASPDVSTLAQETTFTAEPEQRATHVPPYSAMIYQGMGRANTEDDVLHEEPLEIPKYRGGFHKKENLIKRKY